MSQLLGFEEYLGNQTVCKLNKSLYGLKQSPRACFDRFSKAIKEFGYNERQAEHTLFVDHSKKESITISMDDIIVQGMITKMMAKEFEVKDLGLLKYFLGMEIARSKKGIRFPNENTL